MTSADRDVIDVLSSDHDEFLDLIAEIQGEVEPTIRRQKADVLIAELVRHSVAEEMFVYPVMRERLPDGEAAVQHDIDEHKELEVTMKALEDLEPNEALFDQTVAQLESILRDHVKDEEQEQFPRLRAEVPADQLVRLADQVELAKKVAPTRPHPDAPNDALFHMMAGPGVGLVDRLRDTLSGRITSREDVPGRESN